MYFALGFLVAGLFTLMFLPAFWRRAMRLSMRRLNMLTPLSLEKVAAERDLLRAEFAVRYRRLEQQMAAVKATKTNDLVEIGRGAARVAELDDRLTAAVTRGDEFEKKFAESQQILEERTALLNSTEAALLEMTERVEAVLANLRDVETDKEELGRLSDLHLTRVAAHETSIASLHEQNAELRQTLDAVREKLALASAEAERLAEVDAALARTTRELDAAIAEKADLQKALEETRASLSSLERRSALEIENLESALRIARSEERDHADRLETVRSDNALLHGEIEALRKEHARLREVQGGAPAPVALTATGEAQTDRDVLALRQAIVDLGARMAEIASANSNEAAQKRAL